MMRVSVAGMMFYLKGDEREAARLKEGWRGGIR
jgi:hypothetical protein